jgi:hypothetical protein
LATQAPVAPTAGVDQLVDLATQPSESAKQAFRDKYADKLKAKLAEKNAATVEDYLKVTKGASDSSSSSSDNISPLDASASVQPQRAAPARSANPARQASLRVRNSCHVISVSF